MIKATKAQKERMAKVAMLPCSVNNEDCSHGVQVHHITKTGRRLGHDYTIPLCFNHHHNQTPLPYGEAVHKGTKAFEDKYGTQEEMLERTNQLLEVMF